MSVWHRAARWCRAPIGLTAICLFSLNGMGVLAHQTTGAATGIESDFGKWALTQGGLAIGWLITLWSYRRDLARILREEQGRTQVLTALVEKVTTALTHLADEIEHCPFHEAKPR